MNRIWSALICLLIVLVYPNLHAQNYEKVPTESERKADARYQRFPGWQTIEFVKNNVINERLNERLSTLPDKTNWPSGIDLSSFKWLELQNLDLLIPEIKPDGDIISIPFFVDLRFQERHNPLAQATLNSEGLILASIRDGHVQDLSVIRYHTSQTSEDWGRTFGIISKYDETFVNNIIQPALTDYLWNSEGLRKVIRERTQRELK